MAENRQLATREQIAALVPIGQTARQVDLAPVFERVNVLGPRTMVYAGDGMRLRPVFVALNPDPNGGDVYSREGKLALTKIGLLKLSEAKGIIWDAELSRRTNDAPPCEACAEKGRPCNHNTGFKAVGAWLDATGQWQRHSATKYWLYDEELAEVERTSRNPEQEFARRLRVRHELAETKAKLRVIREIGVKAAYTAAELQKGFLCLRVEPDLTPEQVQQQALTSSSLLYGTPSAPALPVPEPALSGATELPDDDGPIDVEPTEVPTEQAAADTPGPWDTDPTPEPPAAAPAMPTREEALSEVTRLWRLAEKAKTEGKLAELPSTVKQNAEVGKLVDWCVSVKESLKAAGVEV